MPYQTFASLTLMLFSVFKLVCQVDPKLPNILWIVTEDNSKHYLELYDPHGAEMKNIEALAEKGVVFNNAFSNAPVCSVARSTIISGCYAPRIGAQYHRKMELVPMPEDLKMFPFYLKEAGYYTSNNAKEDYNLIKSEGVWDESSRKATYKNRKIGQPFFHVQNFHQTHEGQLHFSKEFLGNNPIQNAEKSSLFPYFPNTEIFQYTDAYYRNLHINVDQEIGKFLSELEEEGLMENTIIFYYGDHGGVLPRSKGYVYESGVNIPFIVYVPEKWSALTTYEPGTTTDDFIQFVDLAPTLLNLAGLDIPEQIDGRPFLGKGLSKEELGKKNMAFSYADRFDEKYDMVRAIRIGEYKYIRNYQPFNIDGLFNFYRYKMLAWQEWNQLFVKGELDTIQDQFFRKRSPEALYNIEKDPHETVNLINDPEYLTIAMELRKELSSQVKNMPDLSFYPEPYFLDKGNSNPVQFGQDNKEKIKAIVDIADLQLLPFSKVEKQIKHTLNSKNPWEKYWALIVCSSFGNEAETFIQRAQEIVRSDNESLVQIRAVEFLGLIGQEIDKDLIIEILKHSKSESESNLILNTVALFKTEIPNFEIEIPVDIFNKKWLDNENDLVKRRIEFINN